MKSILSFVFFFIMLLCNGQKLKFDIKATYLIKNDTFLSHSSSYGSSVNENYVMSIRFRTKDTIAEVFNIVAKQKHTYQVIEHKNEIDSLSIKFKYLETKSFTLSKKFNINEFAFKHIKIVDTVETFQLVHSKRNKVKYEFKAITSPINLFYLFRFGCLHGIEFETNLNYSKPVVITHCITPNKKTEFTLIEFNEVDLKLELPEKIIRNNFFLNQK
jgi:hypothetical protein